MALSLELLLRIGRSKKNSSLMMKDRGFILPIQEEELEKMSDLSVGARYMSLALKTSCTIAAALSCIYASSKENQNTVVLFFDVNYDEIKKREKMVSMEQAKSMIAHWKEKFSSCQKCILISPGKLSSDAKKEITIQNVQLLSYSFLSIPVGRHLMVPSHSSLLKEEKEKFLIKRKLDPSQLPILKITDPVCQYYGFEVGMIVRIKRPAWDVFRVVSL